METEPSCKKMDTVVKLDSVSSVFKSLCNLDSNSHSPKGHVKNRQLHRQDKRQPIFYKKLVVIALKDIVTLCNIIQFVFLPSALMLWSRLR